jgi:putative ATP-binding cassette transporter
VDLTLHPGEALFLIGGNGSGKTTLAKLLIGLYAPEEGEIRLDGRLVTEETRDEYLQRFSVVFYDFFLFDRLFGVDPGHLRAHGGDYLARLQLDRKVRLEGDRLSTLDLSQGQRKRLALLAAYLEDRPIHVFDEWASDQDPTFKEVFYHQLLPELKARGKTVVVITHDDHYFDAADRIVKLEQGRVEYDEWPKTATGAAARADR